MTVPLDEADEKALRVGRARIAQFDAAREGTRTAAESLLVSSLRAAYRIIDRLTEKRMAQEVLDLDGAA